MNKLLIFLSIIIIIFIIYLLITFTKKENLNNYFIQNSEYYLSLLDEPLPVYIKNTSYMKKKFNSLYKKLFDPNIKIIVIGNGPVNITDKTKINNIQNNIKNADIIIRFNEWETSSNVDLLGKRCDICFLCWLAISNKKKFNSKILYILLEDILIFMKITIKSKLIKNNILEINNKVKKIINKNNLSRGFITLIILMNYYKNINIIGFGGIGHHNNINNRMDHNQDKEYKFINDLIKKGKLNSLILK